MSVSLYLEVKHFLTRTEAPRVTGIGGRHHSVDYDQGRSHSGSGLQMFYANQRHQSRPNDAEHMAQAKRRMAAQRERELRNYHQEQQFNRSRPTPRSTVKRFVLTCWPK